MEWTVWEQDGFEVAWRSPTTFVSSAILGSGLASSREIEGEDALEVEPNVVGREHKR